VEHAVLPLVGAPFVDGGRDRLGLDCWGFVRLVYLELGLELPLYGDVYDRTTERETIARHVEATAREWVEVPAGAERPGDVVLLRLLGRPMHVGMVIEPGLMAHADPVAGVVVERYRGCLWAKRVQAFYRRPEWT
jgi:cell wall-associated NlpC family hydrolase